MKKYTVLVGLSLAMVVFGSAAFAQQGGFTGPVTPGTASAQMDFRSMTIGQFQTLPTGKSYVVLTGNVVNSLGRDRYTFRDSTGEIMVEIERYVWWDMSVSPTDRVQLLVKVERNRNGRIEVEGKGIRRI
ncbi:MAG: NirD/YgiW/YdeI family stress tolerance protein [Treponema sp.]|nr:NirD/YgiW/YdeI family stress tolerance protein [Treponema sp.]